MVQFGMKKVKKRSAGRPVESKSKDLKEVILQTYLEMCQLEGIENITLQKVAARSGVALTTVRYHFQLHGPSLSEVAQAYISDKTYEFLDLGMLNARTHTDYEPVKAYINVTFDWIEQQPVQASFLLYYYYLSSTQAPIKIGNRELVEIAQRRILGLIYEGIGMKLYTSEAEPSELSEHIHRLVMSSGIIAMTSRDEAFAKQQRENCHAWAAKLLRR